jgi:ABC-type transport system involved in multi-copper enzyme maturation permease subunit
MRRFRFHLATLVILVLLLPVGLAALRESNEIWDSSIFSLTLGVLLISILLAIYRTEKRRAFWIGFALFGSAYLALSLVPSIESRLITSKALHYLDSKMPRSISGGLAYIDPYVVSWDVVFSNNSQPNAVVLDKEIGKLEDVTAAAGSNLAWFPNILAEPLPNGSTGTTENFIRIGHSLLAVVAALLGGRLSKHLHKKNPQGTSGAAPAPVPISN